MRYKKTAAAVAVAMTVSVSALAAASVWSAPGDSSDPLVSKSYVDKRIEEVKAIAGQGGGTSGSADNDALLSEILGRVEQIYGSRIQAAAYTPVFASAGQTILGAEGAEILLRSGKAVGRAPGANGLVNATDGSEIMNGTEVEINNIIIVPRGDGRGVTAMTDAWFLVKGGYTIAD
ncbi:MAG: hypothetical protein LBK41_07225 [Clostridiales bacterium]|jgi:hypothetical protein|nr:hypothetical protein [Clostridiales bacterium]